MFRGNHRRIILDLLDACRSNDETRVSATLHPEVTALIDGGGDVGSATGAVRGARPAARALIELLAAAPDTTVSEQAVNGRTALVFRQGARVSAVLSAEVRAGAIREIWIVVNPDKLRHWNRG